MGHISKFKSKYEPIKDSLAKNEHKMNHILFVICFIVSLLYAFAAWLDYSYYSNDMYPREFFNQVYFALGFFIALNLLGGFTVVFKNKYPKLPKYLFLIVFLLKGILGTIFTELSSMYLFILPLVLSIGFYDTVYSIITSVSVFLSYLASGIISAFYGLTNIAYLDILSIEGLVYTFSKDGYVYNRLLSDVFPLAIVLGFIALISVMLAKNGADFLLQEYYTNKDKVELNKEMALGTEIQNSMLPDRILENQYFSAFSYMLSAKNVGGDFLDYFMISDTKVLITIGDVSGKGIAASLFASNTKALIRAYAKSGLEPGTIMQETNNTLYETNKKKLFVTIWIAIVDLLSGDCIYCSAGHNPPLIKKADGEAKFIEGKQNFIVGRRKNISYLQHHVKLECGDSVILYTDGITEAVNESNEMYGENRLLSFVSNNNVDDRFTKDLRTDIFSFKGNAEQYDDISIACLKINKLAVANEYKKSFIATRSEYPHLVKFVNDFVIQYTENKKIHKDIELCLGEIFSNMEFYGAGDNKKNVNVDVVLSYNNDTITIKFADDGIQFDPLEHKANSIEFNRSNNIIGGFGIFMVKKLMTDVSYKYENNHNILVLTKSIMEETK